MSLINAAASWFLFSKSFLNQTDLLPDETYLVIDQYEKLAYGRLGNYLLLTQNKALIDLSEKKSRK